MHKVALSDNRLSLQKENIAVMKSFIYLFQVYWKLKIEGIYDLLPKQQKREETVSQLIQKLISNTLRVSFL